MDRKVKVNLDGNGIGSVVIDGVDLASFTDRMEIVVEAGKDTVIKLYIPAAVMELEAAAKVDSFIYGLVGDRDE